ncbi:MAG: hypothetical protein NTW38_03975 [Candidatus Aminicenantes bacterium]|nr:hypothetical protein [Candidatus Aminicenantes bacterium]
MTDQKKSGGTKVVAFILTAAILGGVFAGSGLALPKGICETALERCMVNAAAGLFGELLGIVITVSSCLAGYDFCRKYVLPPR